MRNAILLIVVTVLCGVGLFRPFVALLAYFWFGLMRPDLLAFAYGAQPVSLVLSIVLVVSSLRRWHQFPRIFFNPIVRWFLVLQLSLLLSVIFAVDVSLTVDPYLEYLRIILIPLFIPVLVQSTDDLKTLLLLVALSVGLVGVKFGTWGLLAGGVVFAAGYGGMLTDNNDMALAFVMTAVLCWYCRELVDNKWAKLLLLFTTFATATAIVMTHSRGAALSTAAVLCLILMRSKRRLLTLAVVVCLLAPSVYLVRESYTSRLSTLQTYEEDSSAMGRIENAKTALAMWKDHPFFGVGFGMNNFLSLSDQYGGRPGLVVHNTYLQTLVDDGVFATVTYVGLLFGTMIWLGISARRVRRVDAKLALYPVSIQTALAAFTVGSTFLSRLQFDLLYILIMCAAAWHPMEKSFLAAAIEAEDFSSQPELGLSHA